MSEKDKEIVVDDHPTDVRGTETTAANQSAPDMEHPDEPQPYATTQKPQHEVHGDVKRLVGKIKAELDHLGSSHAVRQLKHDADRLQLDLEAHLGL